MHPALPCTHFDFDTRRPEVLEGKPGLATRTPIAVQAPWQGREARYKIRRRMQVDVRNYECSHLHNGVINIQVFVV